MDRRTVGTKNPGCCREVVVIERWPLVEVRLQFIVRGRVKLKIDMTCFQNVLSLVRVTTAGKYKYTN